MDQEDDIFYCSQPECKHPTKIITSLTDQKKNHKSHQVSYISDLRKELQEQNTNFNPLQPDTLDEKEDLLTYIDSEVEKLIRTFLITIGNFGENLKKYVNENICSLKKTQLLFKAVIENNLEQITLHQDHLQSLKKDNKFEDQKEILEQVRKQISSTIKSTIDKITTLNKLNLTKPSLVKYAWSNTNKHTNITVEGRLVKNVSGYNTVLLENRLSLQKAQTIKLKIVAMQEIFLLICDLKTIKTKYLDFLDIYHDGFGAYQHFNNGDIYTTDYGQGTRSFKFSVGDIIELRWNGPKKQFITHKVKTGEKFVFDVSYDANAELYFGVGIANVGTVKIM